jgi:tRNA(adenine34) deaminase
MIKDDRYWMVEALAEAETALAEGEVPVGAIVVRNGEAIGRGHNRVEQKGMPFEHAEVVAMWDAVRRTDRWALTESVLYVTIEPCAMCVGAILLGRLPKVVFGAREPRTGACESVLAIPTEPALEHRLTVIGGVEERRCRELLQRSFKAIRDDKASDAS